MCGDIVTDPGIRSRSLSEVLGLPATRQSPMEMQSLKLGQWLSATRVPKAPGGSQAFGGQPSCPWYRTRTGWDQEAALST